MKAEPTLFHSFRSDISGIGVPDRFNYPFLYVPHELAKTAARELMEELPALNERHDFGLESSSNPNACGKMFGILVVSNPQGETGFLKAFSGKLGDHSELPGFVPPIYNRLLSEGFFLKGEATLNELNRKIALLEADPELKALEILMDEAVQKGESELESMRKAIRENRSIRQSKREALRASLRDEERAAAEQELDKESQDQQRSYKRLLKLHRKTLDDIQARIDEKSRAILALREQRKKLSAELQSGLFAEYNFLNRDKQTRNVREIFKDTVFLTPPAGAGDCAAPKLLQYAFEHELIPIALAEFWWGASPPGEVRKHREFYPACRGKCEPILGHMLAGIELDPNPITQRNTEELELEWIYEDEFLSVIAKPAGLLAVPGKNERDSVLSRMKQRYPEATGPLIVHRLDLSTSGIMVVAKTESAYLNLQRQFLKKTIQKRYAAVLEGELESDSGIVDLPLRVDLENRPQQMVCYEHGKWARTEWKRIRVSNGNTLVHFYPITGRTHQLRVHAAHSDGLNTPIVGDELYGHPGNRLMLHAEWISFVHPESGERMEFSCPSDFRLD